MKPTLLTLSHALFTYPKFSDAQFSDGHLLKAHPLKSSLLKITVLSATVMLSGCSDGMFNQSPSVPTILTAERTFGIRHDVPLSAYEAVAGTDTGLNTPDFRTVMNFEYSLSGDPEEVVIASGVLIAPQWVLTAGHNFYVAEEQNEAVAPSDIRVNIGNNPNQPERTIGVERVVLHPTWVSQGDGFVNGNDIALVKLNQSITNITPAKLYNRTSPEQTGDVVWFAGFGDYSQLQGQNPEAYSRLHAIQNQLDRTVSGLTTQAEGKTYDGGVLAIDFDSPNNNNASQTSNTLGDNIVREEEQVLGAGTSHAMATSYEGTTVQGDSGGPLFVSDAGQWRVAGVLSGGIAEPFIGHKDGNYGDISVFTRVADHAKWIEATVEATATVK